MLQRPLPAGKKLEDCGMAHRGEGRERVEQRREHCRLADQLVGLQARHRNGAALISGKWFDRFKDEVGVAEYHDAKEVAWNFMVIPDESDASAENLDHRSIEREVISKKYNSASQYLPGVCSSVGLYY